MEVTVNGSESPKDDGSNSASALAILVAVAEQERTGDPKDAGRGGARESRKVEALDQEEKDKIERRRKRVAESCRKHRANKKQRLFDLEAENSMLKQRITTLETKLVELGVVDF
eukprot:comp12563_c0_seq1/m.7561 comp12563_c0_seq1/g.7561  ORF comp12563_c0_seq1/g.7561 comp12563_c0_seq1/m.7561 type:complete len:114 (-) comp12563_c0_seq1:459-800(-)